MLFPSWITVANQIDVIPESESPADSLTMSRDRARQVNRFRQFECVLLAAVVSSALSGCLFIGGKMNNPEVESRLDSLESRVSTLEQMSGTATVSPR
jgi:hypothetical protein